MPRFAPAAVALLESDVREFAASLVDGVANTGRADLYETLAKPLPLLMITRLLGIERDDLFWEWVELLMYGRVEGIRCGDDRRNGRSAVRLPRPPVGTTARSPWR